MPKHRDAVFLYLKDIGDIPLVSREEEEKLVKQIRHKRRGSKEAKKTLIKANLRLVVTIAKRYAHLGVPFLDLVEEGNLGLIKAIDKYNPDKGAKVSTYASWWIKQAILRALANQGKTVRVPVYLVEKIVTINKAKQALKHKLGRDPKPQEIAKKLKISVDKVRDIEMISHSYSSLHAAIDEEGVGELIDIIENIDAVPPSRLVSKSMLNQDMMDLLEVLNEREQDIVRMRFGLGGEMPKTLQDIGDKYKLTRERVRQIESAAVRKMKQFLKQQKRDFHAYWHGK